MFVFFPFYFHIFHRKPIKYTPFCAIFLFQNKKVGTALLIIYSTFAAIYYSKVNPLVSDYDYTDYLGGGRSLSDDTDFVDDSEDGPHTITSSSTSPSSSAVPSSWSDWLPRTGHSLKFILDAIDSLPLQDDSS